MPKPNHLISFLLGVIFSLVAVIAFQEYSRYSQDPQPPGSDRTLQADAPAPRPDSVPAIYIDRIKGSNLSSGNTEQEAWKDFSPLKRLTLAKGTRILLKRGCTWNTPLDLSLGGTSGNPVVVDAYGNGDLPCIDLAHAHGNGVLVRASYIEINNLRIQNSQNSSLFIRVKGGLSNIRLRNLQILNSGNNGIEVQGGGKDLKITGCTIQNARNNGIYLGGSSSSKLGNVLVENCLVQGARTNDGITIHEDADKNTAGENFILRHNTAKFCAEQGFDITTGRNILLVGNRSERNGEGGIQVAHSATGVTIERHISLEEPTRDTAAAVYLSGRGNIRLLGSIIQGSGYHLLLVMANNVAVFHNNFIWNGGKAPIDIAGKIQNLYFINNIVFSMQKTMDRIRFLEPSRPPDYDSFTFDHNLYYAPDGKVVFYHNQRNYAFEPYQKNFDADPNSQVADPGFKNLSRADFSLMPGSPAVGAARYLASPRAAVTGNTLSVDNALFFFGTPDVPQCVSIKGRQKPYAIVQVDHNRNTIDFRQKVTLSPKDRIGACPPALPPNIGADAFQSP